MKPDLILVTKWGNVINDNVSHHTRPTRNVVPFLVCSTMFYIFSMVGLVLDVTQLNGSSDSWLFTCTDPAVHLLAFPVQRHSNQSLMIIWISCVVVIGGERKNGSPGPRLGIPAVERLLSQFSENLGVDPQWYWHNWQSSNWRGIDLAPPKIYCCQSIYPQRNLLQNHTDTVWTHFHMYIVLYKP